MTQAANHQPITVLVCALGGEGGGVLAEWLVAVARRAGHAAQASSIPGVAQRTGATTYYLEFARHSEAELQGRRPLFALAPLPGCLDLLVGSELLELARQATNGLPSRERTVVVASTARVFTTLERMHGGDGRLDANALQGVLAQHAAQLHLLDMDTLTRQAGTVVSSVMLGAIAGSGVLPFAREHYEAVVGEGGGSAAEASLRGFAAGFAAVTPAKAATTVNTLAAAAAPSAATATATATSKPRVELTVEDTLSLGRARVVEYQDEAYGRMFDQRVQALRDAEQRALPASATLVLPATHEAARWLALWMAFDDIVRVADLKSRASRTARVRAETKAAPDELLKLFDHFKPGVAEFAALLPAALATRLQRWDAARVQRGLQTWALPLKIGSHSVSGLLALRTLASLRWLRKRGQRFAQEQALIEHWLAGIHLGLAASAELGLEVARCGRLIKGYGSTNERGKERLMHVLTHVLPMPGTAAERAQAIAQLRAAALADESGKSFNTALMARGAPTQAPREQPMRWVRKPRPAARV